MAPPGRTRLWAIVNAIRPRYASVLPPPVGNHSRSAVSRSSELGSVIDSTLSRKKASWNMYHRHSYLPGS